MRTLLILSKLRAFPAAVEAAVDHSKYQIILKDDLRAAESLLTRGAVDAVILDLELTDVNAIRLIEQVRAAAPEAPLLVVSADKHWEWEEDAYLLGVAHVIAKPIRGKLLNNLLDRVFQSGPASPLPDTMKGSPAFGQHAAHGAVQHFNALEALRNFSGVLTHSLKPHALLREFLLVLREVIGVNRAVIFLRNPSSLFGTATPDQEDRWLRSACAIGLEQSFLDHFALNLTTGLGAFLRKHGRILKSTNAEVQGNREMAREFQLVGASVAIPILDRETLLGVAVLDERLTGDPYENEELSLLFHMLEEVGLAIRNSWLHDQLETSHAMLTDILANLGTACVVVGNSLAVLHSNASARRILLAENPDKTVIEFSDMPQELGSKVFTVMKTNVAVASFKYQFATLPEQSFLVAISPFQTQKAATADAALLIIENITTLERAKRLEVETSSLRLITTMAEHLAHEIGNSVVPLSTHQQLLDSGMEDEEFRTSLSQALGAGVKRITRLANQMMFLARGKTDFGDQIRVNELIDEAFREAYVYHNGKAPDFDIAEGSEKLTIAGDHKALRHAFSEVLLNALQATPGENKKIAVSISSTGANGKRGVNVEIRDGGTGFTAEAAKRGPEPFFSTRNVGLGLGLTVTRKIIEDHRGCVEIAEPSVKGSGVVRISLPLSDQN
ncbi:MAG TPA: ATP-binding protein [Chthoniobacteraceae bacterium]|jgi:signal transduction histidine kinase/DNA-binding response OmpR family regulator|nr:ATP-binding protein [Chthoniobacteraceae bacterium]